MEKHVLAAPAVANALPAKGMVCVSIAMEQNFRIVHGAGKVIFAGVVMMDMLLTKIAITKNVNGAREQVVVRSVRMVKKSATDVLMAVFVYIAWAMEMAFAVLVRGQEYIIRKKIKQFT